MVIVVDEPEPVGQWPTKFDASVVDQILDAKEFLAQDEREQRRLVQNEGVRLQDLGARAAREDAANRAAVESLSHLNRMAEAMAAVATETLNESKRTKWLLRIATATLIVSVVAVIIALVR